MQPMAAASDGLPAGWRAAVDANGRTFYQNDLTNATQWERPGLTQTSVIPAKPLLSDPEHLAHNLHLCHPAATGARDGVAAEVGKVRMH